jgi:hypothetical protein
MLAADPPDLLQAKLTSKSVMSREMIVNFRFIVESFFFGQGMRKAQLFYAKPSG